jgi:hypothetical protein
MSLHGRNFPVCLGKKWKRRRSVAPVFEGVSLRCRQASQRCDAGIACCRRQALGIEHRRIAGNASMV